MGRKLILFDIDGTIMHYDEFMNTSVPEETKEAVRLLKSNGHMVMFATARSWAASARCANEIGIECSGIFNCGAQIIYNGSIVYENRMETELTNSIFNDIKTDGVFIFGSKGDLLYEHNATRSTYEAMKKEGGGIDILKPFPEFLPPLLSFSIYGLNKKWEGQSELCRKYKEIYFCDRYTEIVKKGVSKGDGMYKLADILGFSIENVIAVGDGLNDIEIIENAGTGIAVGNACDDLKGRADIVADHIANGGILKVFQEIKLI